MSLLIKKYFTLAFILFFYSINSFGISFDQHEQYDHNELAIYRIYNFKQLPNFIAEFVTPGIQLNPGSYSEGWCINGDLLKKEEMNKLFKIVRSYIPHLERIAPKGDIEKAGFMGTGYGTVNLRAYPKISSLGIDAKHELLFHLFYIPQKAKNYKEAASYLKEKLLLADSPETLLQIIITTHEKITNGLQNEEGRPIMGGSYRDTGVVVYPFKTSEHEKAENFMHSFQRSKWGGASYEYAKEELSNGDLIMLAEHGIYLTPIPKKIPKLMDNFARDFLFGMQQIKENKLSPIAFAAWAHLEIVKIHPFIDGNGRLARLVANIILMTYRYPPMIIGSDEDYTSALNTCINTDDPSYFSKYMSETIAWTAKQLNNPQTGLLEDSKTQKEPEEEL